MTHLIHPKDVMAMHLHGKCPLKTVILEIMEMRDLIACGEWMASELVMVVIFHEVILLCT